MGRAIRADVVRGRAGHRARGRGERQAFLGPRANSHRRSSAEFATSGSTPLSASRRRPCRTAFRARGSKRPAGARMPGSLHASPARRRPAALPPRLARETLAHLTDLGVVRMRDMLDLPVEGVSRRFGPEIAIHLGRLMGTSRIRANRIRPPRRFRARLDRPPKPMAVSAALSLAPHAGRDGRNAARARRGVQRLVCGWSTAASCERAWTWIRVTERDKELRLDRARKAGTPTLPAATIALDLRADALLQYVPRESTWLPRKEQAIGRDRLIQRLSARLGRERVFGIAIADDHRPDRGWKTEFCARHKSSSPRRRGSRGRSSASCLASESSTQAREPGQFARRRPERIESGWWDGEEVRRAITTSRAKQRGETRLDLSRAPRRRRLVPARGVRMIPPPARLRRAALPVTTSASCAAPRVRRSWSSAPQSSATRRSPSPTNARSRAWCARTWRRRRSGCKLIIGTEFALDDGLRLVLLATDRAATASSAAAHHARPARGREGQLSRSRCARSSKPLAGCLALLVPLWILAAARTRARQAAGSPRASPAAPGSRSELLSRRRRPRRARPRCDARRGLGLPLVAAGDVHMHVRSRRRAAGHAHRDPPRHAGRGVRPRALSRTASATCARACASPALSARAARRNVRDRRALRFSLDELRYEYPDELVPDGETPATHLRQLTERRRAPALSRGRARRTCATLIEHELALIAELAYEPTSSPCTTSCSFARSAGHPLPGPRLGGELGGVLLPRHHRGRSGAHVGAVRALHLARSATSRPTSTSTSSTSGARRSSSTSTGSTAASAPRSPRR